jgi:redox-regulated HSP33 family molecular chaperone
MRPFNFFADRLAGIIREASKDHFERFDLRMSVKYLIEKTIIICGSLNSGKSTVVEIVAKAYLKMTMDPDVVNRFKGIMPLTVETIYHTGDVWENIFGSIQLNPLHGEYW